MVAFTAAGKERFSALVARQLLALTLVDLDGDGSVETVVGLNDGQVHCFDSAGNARFRMEAGAGPVYRVDPADFDGDGKLEIVAWTTRAPPSARSSAETARSGSSSRGRRSARSRLADVDGDGKSDLVTADRVGNVSLWEVPTDVRARLRATFIDGLDAARRGDEGAAAAAFAKSGFRWLAYVGAPADLFRLWLFRLRHSPSVARMARIYDQVRPGWLDELARISPTHEGDTGLFDQVLEAAAELGGAESRRSMPRAEQLAEALRLIAETDAAASRASATRPSRR